MIIYIRRQGMLEYVEGTVKPSKIPKGKKPSKKKLKDALRALSMDRTSAALKVKYVKLVKLERSFKAYEGSLCGGPETQRHIICECTHADMASQE
jgi:hypothetical protein